MTQLKLMIVDDEATARNGLAQHIDWQSLDIAIIGQAKDGDDAYWQIKSNKPDIVIVDINMPNCDGLTLIERTQSDGLNIKYIILSGYDDFSYAQKAISLNVASYLLKPVNTEKLLQVVASIRTQLNKEVKQIAVENAAIEGLLVRKEKFLNTLIDYQLKSLDEITAQYAELSILVPMTDLRLVAFAYKYEDHLSISSFNEADHRLFRFSIKNILSEFFMDIPLEYIEKGNDEISFIIANDALDLTSFKLKCDECLDIIYSFSKISLFAGISEPISHIKDLATAYRSAHESLSYKLYSPKQRVFLPVPPSTPQTTVPSAANIDTTAIIDAIIRIDFDDIERYCDDFLNALFYVPAPPPRYTKGMCAYMVIDVHKKLSDYKLSQVSSLEHQEHIYRMDSFSDIRAYIIQIFQGYSQELKDRNLLVQDETIQHIKDYLHENIHRKIVLSEIADQIHLSESYLAAYFKKKTGDNFRDYVIRVRMEMAMDALKHTNKTISEISLELGYSDYRSFNRVFKKFTGQTPSDYYALYHKGKNDAV